jgi:hypothetical protein
MLTALFTCVALLGSLVTNGGFESKFAKDAPPPGWAFEIGATNGANEPVSRVEFDTQEAHSGKASLHLYGDDTTRAWRLVKQELPVRPGGTYEFRAFMKTAKVHGEKIAGTDIPQFTNCHAALSFYDDSGTDVGHEVVRPLVPTSSWKELEIKLVAPESTRRAEILFFLSMSGDVWIDDVDVTITGGKELPPPEVLLDEGFERNVSLPDGWTESVGATNGGGTTRSKIEIDAQNGAPNSPHSLHFSGDAQTIRWFDASRTFDVAPGDALRLSAFVKGEKIRKEGVQFPNFHLRLVFQDADKQTVGPAFYAQGGDGTFDWKQVETHGVAPAGAVKVMVGVFLSMSGDAWVDRIEVTKRGGSSAPYADWLTLESKHVVVRYPKNHPRASGMKEYAQALDAGFETVTKKIAVEYTGKITAFVYANKEQGQSMTGRPLAFANPEGKAVHQTMANTISHEMTHVIALSIGSAQTALCGEGLGVWCDGASDVEHHARAAELAKQGTLPAMATLLGDFRGNEALSYPAAGSFVGYVIATFGLDAFKRLYLDPDPAAHSKAVLGKPLDDVDRDWRAFLAKK